MKIVHKHIIHKYLQNAEIIASLNNVQKTGRIVTESTINGTKVRITQNYRLLTKIRLIRNV